MVGNVGARDDMEVRSRLLPNLDKSANSRVDGTRATTAGNRVLERHFVPRADRQKNA